jgi:hypothetical protein
MAAILPQKGDALLFRARGKFVERSNLPQEKSGSARVTGNPSIIW